MRREGPGLLHQTPIGLAFAPFWFKVGIKSCEARSPFRRVPDIDLVTYEMPLQKSVAIQPSNVEG